MVFDNALNKASRLMELQLYFWRNPKRTLRTRQLADRLGIAPRTVRKYITELSASGRLPVYHEGKGWKLTEGAHLEVAPVRFHLEEAAALFLAARMLERHADEPNPAVTGALAKLATAVPAELRAAFDAIARRRPSPKDSHFGRVFHTVAYGWALNRVVRIRQVPRSTGREEVGELRPYLLEPSAVGSAIYAIGRVDPPGELRVIKLERVREATLTPANFIPPPLDDLVTRLDRAWGVWMSETDVTTVRLSFAQDIAARVLETRWHPSQQITERADGGLDMTVAVTSTLEMHPWILGWGRHCEVLEPADLRRRISDELNDAAQNYEGGP